VLHDVISPDICLGSLREVATFEKTQKDSGNVSGINGTDNYSLTL